MKALILKKLPWISAHQIIYYNKGQSLINQLCGLDHTKVKTVICHCENNLNTESQKYVGFRSFLETLFGVLFSEYFLDIFTKQPGPACCLEVVVYTRAHDPLLEM